VHHVGFTVNKILRLNLCTVILLSDYGSEVRSVMSHFGGCYFSLLLTVAFICRISPNVVIPTFSLFFIRSVTIRERVYKYIYIYI
jgi:hypothetical protein